MQFGAKFDFCAEGFAGRRWRYSIAAIALALPIFFFAELLHSQKANIGPVQVKVTGPKSVAVKSTTQLTGEVVYRNGTSPVSKQIKWKSGDTSIATVDQTGKVTGQGTGSSLFETATIYASSGPFVASTPIMVYQAHSVTALSVSPKTKTVSKGRTQQLTATATFSNTDSGTSASTSTSADVTDFATWSSSNTSVATVSQDGVVTAVAGSGTATITASFGGTTATATIQAATPTLTSIAVTPLNPTVSKGVVEDFVATGTFSDSSTSDITSTATWSSTNTAVATVVAGVATTLASGSATIKATQLGILGSSVLTVVPALTITTATLPQGNTNVAYSQILAKTGGVLPVSWSISSGTLPTGLTLSSTGTISGTPTATGTFSFTVAATDAGTPPAQVTKSLQIFVGNSVFLDSAGGNDANTGASPAQAWQTLGKVNGIVFHPGDHILLKAGDTWGQAVFLKSTTAMQIINSNGTAAQPITITSYGTGALPLINGAGTPNATFGIVINKSAFVTVKGLNLRNFDGEAVNVITSAHATIRNSVFKNIKNAAISIDNAGNSPAITVDHNTFTNDTGIKASSGLIRLFCTTCDNPTISNNTVGDLGSPFGIMVSDANNAKLFGNNVTGNGHDLTIEGQTRSVTGGQIHDNIAVGASTTEGDGEDITLTGACSPTPCTPHTVTADIFRNFALGGSTTAHGIAIFNAVNCKIYQNIVLNIPNGASFHLTSASTNNVLYNNSAYGALTYAFGFFNSSTGNTMRNNIAVNVTQEGIGVGNDSVTGFSEDYDILSGIGGLETSTNITPGPHTITTDPKFAVGTPAGPNDFKLQLGSPAIDSCLNLGSPYNLALDPLGTGVPYPTIDQNSFGTGWDCGAFVFRP